MIKRTAPEIEYAKKKYGDRDKLRFPPIEAEWKAIADYFNLSVNEVSHIMVNSPVEYNRMKQEEYHASIAKLDEDIQRDMHENELNEQKSNQLAHEFHTTTTQL